MKKILFFAIAILSLVHAQNIMSLNAVSGPANDTVTVSLSITNQDTVTGFQCDIPLPEHVSFVENSVTLSGREDDHVIVEDVNEEDILTIFAYSMSLAEFSGTSGEVCSFKLVLGTVPGTYVLDLEDVTISDKSSNNIATSSDHGYVSIEAPDIYISPDSLAYGRVSLLDSLDKSFTIQNDGNIDLSVTNIISSHSDFEVLGSTAFTLSSGSSRSVTARFHSDVKGNYSENISVLSNDPDETNSIVKVSSIAYAVNELNIDNMFARSGHTVTAYVDISNMEAFTAFSFDLDIPEVMTLVSGTAALSDRKTDHAVSASTLANGNIRIMAYSVSNDAFSGTSGEVLTFDLNVDGPGGYYNVTFVDPVIADSNSTNIISDSYNATLEIAAPDIGVSPSPVNFGNVSVFDTATVNCTISNSGSDTLNVTHLIFYDEHFSSPQTLPFKIAPRSQQIVAIDFHNELEHVHNSTLRIRSNDPDEDPKDITLTATSFIPNIMRVDSSDIVQNDTGWVYINIENNEDFVGFQCDLGFAEGFTYLGTSELTDRADGHSLSVSEKEGNIIGLFAYSMSQTAFMGTGGAVARLAFLAPSNMDDYDFTLSDVIIANAASENIMSSYEGGVITVVTSGPTLMEFPDIEFKEDKDTTFDISSLVSDPNTAYGDLNWSFSGDDSLTLNVTGNDLNISANDNWFGIRSVTAEVSDGELTDTNTFIVSVTKVNDAPVAKADSGETYEDVSLEIILYANDIDSETLNYAVLDSVVSGKLEGTAPYLTYFPDENYFGKDSLSFIVDDGELSDTAVFQINILPMNDPPVAVCEEYDMQEDSILTFILRANDPEDDALNFSILDSAKLGVIYGTLPQLNFSPISNIFGEDSLRYIVSDGASQDTGRVKITISPVNDSPIVISDSCKTQEDQPLEIVLRATDIDSEDLNFTILNNPQLGILEGNAPNLTYTTDADVNGFDSLRFIVSDGQLSDTGKITIEIIPENDAPFAIPNEYDMQEDSTFEFSLEVWDSDHDELTFEILDSTKLGPLSGVLPDLQYLPAKDVYGADSLRFIVSDGILQDTGKVKIVINPVNDPPKVTPGQAQVPEDTPTGIDLEATDVDNANLVFSIVDSTLHGILSGNVESLIYTPNANYFGFDSLRFCASDGFLSDTGIFHIEVLADNDAPVWSALPDTSFDEDDSLKVHVMELFKFVEDPDNELKDMIISATVPEVLHCGWIDSTFYLTADANWFGKDSIELDVSDGVDSAQIIWHITVDPVNDAPVFTTLINTARNFNAETRDTIYFADLFEDIDTPDTSVSVTISATEILYDVHQSSVFLELYISENITISEAIEITLNDGDNIVSRNLEVEIIEVAIDVIPENFALYPPYPNPFNPSTTITYDIPDLSDVNIVIYNVNGQRIRTLVDGEQPAKAYRLIWNGKSDHGGTVPSGMYIYRIVANSADECYVDYRKMLFIK